MPHNFRVPTTIITSPVYVSKAGSSGNAGTDPNLPKDNIQASGNQIVGTGVYIVTPTAPIIYADGSVVMQPATPDTGTFQLSLYPSNNPSFGTPAQGYLLVKDYFQVNLRLGCHNLITYDKFRLHLHNINTVTFPTGAFSQGYAVFTNIPFLTNSGGAAIGNIFYNCGIYESVLGSSGGVTNSHLGVQQCNFFAGNYNSFTYNNFPSPCKIRFTPGGTWYAVQDGKVGTPQDNGYDVDVVWLDAALVIAEIGISRGTQVQWQSTFNTWISREPEFNDPENFDFSVKITSDLLGTGLPYVIGQGQNGNIAQVTYGKSYQVTSLTNINSLSTGVSDDISIVSSGNLSLDADGSIVINTGTDGTIETDWIHYSTLLSEIGRIVPLSNVTFNRSTTAGTGDNINVTDSQVYTAIAASGGGNPDRLVFEMITSTQTTKPTTLAEGDWQGIFPAGTWKKFQWWVKPTIDIALRTNGEPEFVFAGTNVGVNAKWIKLRFTITNAYTG